MTWERRRLAGEFTLHTSTPARRLRSQDFTACLCLCPGHGPALPAVRPGGLEYPDAQGAPDGRVQPEAELVLHAASRICALRGQLAARPVQAAREGLDAQALSAPASGTQAQQQVSTALPELSTAADTLVVARAPRASGFSLHECSKTVAAASHSVETGLRSRAAGKHGVAHVQTARASFAADDFCSTRLGPTVSDFVPAALPKAALDE